MTLNVTKKGNVRISRNCRLHKKPSVKDELIMMTEVMENETKATDKPVSVRGKIQQVTAGVVLNDHIAQRSQACFNMYLSKFAQNDKNKQTVLE
jgi:hypothetical protein